MIGPESPPLPRGPSTFADPAKAPVSGHWHRLPQGTPLPEGLAVIADGLDVEPHSLNPESHHTIYPTKRMHVDEFIKLFVGLPWQHGGRKK